MPNPWGIEGNPLEDPENMVHIEGTGPGQPRADANDPNPDCLTRRRASVLLGGERFGEHLGLPQACTECSGSSGSPKNQRHVWRGVFNITSRKNGEIHFKGDLHLFFVDVILWGIQVLGI